MATNKAIGELIFRISADTKAIRKGMAQTQKAISGLKRSINTIAVAAAAAFSIRAIAGFTKEIVKLAGEMEGVSDAFQRIAPLGLLDDLKDATKDTVSELNLMKRAVMANNFRIPLEQLASLFAFATKRAQQTGESVDYLVNSIVLGIGRKAPLILDNLGISAVRLREELENAGHSGSTVFEVAQAVGKIAQTEMAEAGDIIDTTKLSTEQLTASMADLKVEMGQNLTPAVQKATKALALFVEKIMLVPGQEGKRDAAKRVEEFKKQLVGLDKEARKSKIIEQITLFRDVLNGFQKDLVDLGGEKLTFWQQLWNPDFDIKDWKLQVSVTEELIAEYKELIRVYRELLNSGAVAKKTVGKDTRPMEVKGKAASAGMGGGRTFGYTMQGMTLAGDPKKRFDDVLQFTGIIDNVEQKLRKSNLTVEKATAAYMEFGIVFQQAFMGAVDAFGSFIESIAAGTMESAFNTLLKLVGGFMVQMGKLIVAYAITMEAFQDLIKNPFRGSALLALGAGLGLIAIGSAISGLASRGPSMSGVSASGGSGGGVSQSRPTVVLRGQDIYISGQRAAISMGQGT